DKTAIEVDRTGGACDGNVYFAWARFTGGGPSGFNSSVYFVRSTDHGQTFSLPQKLSQTVHDIQFPDISVTGDGHVYVTYREVADVRSNQATDAIAYNASTDCGATFSPPHVVTTFEPYDPTDISGGDVVGECGDSASACDSGYTFMRGGTQVRATADQADAVHDYVYVVYDPSIPGTEVPSGTTYGSVVSEDLPVKYHQGVGSQSGIYFLRLDGGVELVGRDAAEFGVEQSELRAVLGADGAVRRRLPVRQLGRNVLVRHVDRLAKRRSGAGPA